MVRGLATTRYQPSVSLRQYHIPYVVWFEDTLQYYQVPTIAFHLYLLVDDLDRAAYALVSLGWTVDKSTPAKIGNAAVSTKQHRLSPPRSRSQILNGADTTQPVISESPDCDQIVLLSANDWHFQSFNGRNTRNWLVDLPSSTSRTP
jgi:hypothetical protein